MRKTSGKGAENRALGHVADRETGSTDVLRASIRKCSDIPVQVREADFTRIDERKIDTSLLRLITETGEPKSADDQAIRRRMDSLSPFAGQTLVCVVITLPGVSYTIEIDPTDERVVHWEWRAT